MDAASCNGCRSKIQEARGTIAKADGTHEMVGERVWASQDVGICEGMSLGQHNRIRSSLSWKGSVDRIEQVATPFLHDLEYVNVFNE